MFIVAYGMSRYDDWPIAEKSKETNLFISRSALQMDLVLTPFYSRGMMVHWSEAKTRQASKYCLPRANSLQFILADDRRQILGPDS
uniref:Uncharacterized protein n=1 Tax=Candidatus Kentrum sp. SD TaxID=2126332 RepID=A0A450YW75_9GAMM|nr:MAG: hypothetical protein BECKSD772F_GA0070984_10654 [Candidatus Kentron sp. SD]VFK45784.1 MAG: hypothetical protein BECKSD772E_GA0070983_10605 [Candidatus Kentron sp. SD]